MHFSKELMISNNCLLLLTTCLLLDMSKAFDSIDHQILLHKMQNVRTLTSALKWFNSYLTNVYQVVMYEFIVPFLILCQLNVVSLNVVFFLGALLFSINYM